MEYIYTILLLQALGKIVTEENVRLVVESLESKVDEEKLQDALQKMTKTIE